MNHIISFQRIKLLTIRYFAENGRKGLIRLSIFFLIFAFLPRLINSSYPLTSFVIFCAILFIGGISFTAHIFKEIHKPFSGMHYLHIPASRFEKFLFNGTLSLLYYPAVCLLLYYGGALFGNLVAPIIPSFLNYQIIDISYLMPKELIGKLVSQFVLTHAFFFLGSLAFKKNNVSKTFISLIVISLIIGIVQMMLMKILWTDYTSTDFNIKIVSLTENLTGIRHGEWISIGAIAIFLWIVSYFKLKEKQV